MTTVTSDHRSRAFTCIWSDQPSRLERLWIEPGEHEGAAGPRLVRTALAFAEFESLVRAEERAK